ncbi:MAG: TrkA family potassium uptake protein [bacterium]|nr:TrkA family potassium uptake protein [bacterium]
MNAGKQKVLIFGLGYFGKELLRSLSSEWHVVVVGMKESQAVLCRAEFPDVEYRRGSGDSPVTWKKLDLENVKYIISAVRDVEVDLEICRTARDSYKLKIPIIVLVYEDIEENLFEKFHVTVINPLKLGAQAILKTIEKNVSYAANVGLGKGELIEVGIMARSHLVGRKLKYLKPAQWHISALYREGKLIMPTGNCSLKIGDRVLLVGDPKVLANVSNTLLKGLPEFPLQYGTDIVFPLHTDFRDHMDEAVYLLNSFNGKRIRFIRFKEKLDPAFTDKIKKEVTHFEIGQAIGLFKEIFTLPLDTGVLVVPVCHGWLKRSRLRETFKRSRKPFLLSRMSYPYEGVVISLNGPDPVQALETGLEMAKMLKISYRVVYVTLPKEMRGREEDQRLRFRREIVSDFEGIYKAAIDYKVLEGNPVRQMLMYLAPLGKHILVTVTDPYASLSFFKPNVTYMVACKTHLSTLVIPEVYTNE